MRVMVIVKATPDSEAGQLPSAELLSEMGQFNEQLVKAGIMLAQKGCTRLPRRSRQVRRRPKPVTDGPSPPPRN